MLVEMGGASMMETVLVSGGAGYIGSHTVKQFMEQGRRVVVLDDLSTGHRQAVQEGVPFYQGDIADTVLVQEVVTQEGVTAVIHFAAKSLVGESMADPALYFLANTAKSVRFLDTLARCGVKRVVFSSTAAVYGIPKRVPIAEDDVKAPINPYGASKKMVEEALPWLEEAHGLKWMVLRYFNAAGAAAEGVIGEDHRLETHLIPLVLQVALGKREAIQIYGTDYQTRDGTCIRDYIHVEDLAEAHRLALEALEGGMPSDAYNVGTGEGYTVQEVVQAARQVTGREIPAVAAPRRIGDPPELVAAVSRIEQELGWRARKSDLTSILRDAWRWHVGHPKGYDSI